jgi:hypothetical protein
MVENCKYCGKDIKDLRPTQKGQHVANCVMNPNFKFTAEKRSKSRLNTQRLKNPLIKLKLNCLNCNKEFEVEVIESYYKRGRYIKCCCKKCAHKYSSNFLDKNKKKVKRCKDCGKEIQVNILSSDNIRCDNCRKNPRGCDSADESLKFNKRRCQEFKNNKYVCKHCGEEECKRPEVCKLFRQKHNVYDVYFGFDINKKGTNEFYNEFDRIVNMLKEDYFDKELSLTEIANKYKMNYQTVHMVFKKIGIIARTISEAGYLAAKNGKGNSDNAVSYPYKSGYHINWKGKEVHYRSNYEKEYYSILDEKKVNYEIENLRIVYYDTQKKKFRIAIPDIYIKDMNEIIEIKSKWTLDEINMNDKIKAYKTLGYNVKVMIGEGNKNFFKNAKEIIY